MGQEGTKNTKKDLKMKFWRFWEKPNSFMRTFLLEYENDDSLLTFWGGGTKKTDVWEKFGCWVIQKPLDQCEWDDIYG